MSLVPGSPADRMSCMNAARSVERGQQLTYDNRPVNEDVFFDLIEQEKIAYGQPFNVQVHIQVSVKRHSPRQHFHQITIQERNTFCFKKRIALKRPERLMPFSLPIQSSTPECLPAASGARNANSCSSRALVIELPACSTRDEITQSRFNFFRQVKLFRSESAGRTIATRSLTTATSKSTAPRLCRRRSNCGAKKTTSNWRSPNWMSRFCLFTLN